MHGQNGEFEATLDLERRAIDHWDRIGHRFGQITTRANHTFTLFNSGRYSQSMALAEEIVQRASEAGVPTAEATALQSLALCLLAEGQASAAGPAAERAAQLFEQVDNLIDAREMWELAATAWDQAGDGAAAQHARAAATSETTEALPPP